MINKKMLIGLIVIGLVSIGIFYFIYLSQPEEPIESEKPNLDKPIEITADLPDDAKEIAKELIRKNIEALKENPDFFGAWLELGVYRKMIGDLEGAVEVWEYAGVIRPKNSTSFANLADVYGFYLKNNEKAEENFLKALENGPNKINIYRNAYEFYRFAMEDDEQAKQILQKGIDANPGFSQDLEYLLANFYSL